MQDLEMNRERWAPSVEEEALALRSPLLVQYGQPRKMRQRGLPETAGLTQDFHFLERLVEVTRDRVETKVCGNAEGQWGCKAAGGSSHFSSRRGDWKVRVCVCVCVCVCVSPITSSNVIGASRPDKERS